MLKNRIVYAVISALAAALFIFYHNFFFFYLLLVVMILPFVSFALTKYIKSKINIKCEIPLVNVGEGNEIPIKFTSENLTVFPLPGVRLEYTVCNNYYPNEELQEMSLPLRRGVHTFVWHINSVYAGRVILKGRKIKIQDYLGLFVFTAEWPVEAAISVLPKQSDVIMNVIETSVSQGDEFENNSTSYSEDVTQIKEFRQYKPGDRMSRVNWKISARHDEIYVREFEREYNRTLTLLVELRRDSEETGFLDELITAFYSAGIKLLDMDISFRIQWFDCETNRFMTETVNNPDALTDALQQMYLMQSYTDYFAFNHYREASHGPDDVAVYFTSPSFSLVGEEAKVGTFKERVTLICL